MSGLMDLQLDKVEDPIIVPGGEEYELRIVSAQIAPSKSSSRDLIKVTYEIVDQPTAAPIFDNMSLPTKEDSEKNTYFFQLQLKKFCQAFGFDLKNPGNPEEWKGSTAWAVLNQKENEQTGNLENTVGRWIVKK